MPIAPHPRYGHPYWAIWPISLQRCSAIVLLDGKANREGREEGQMNHYMDFDPYVIRERNEQMRGEVESLRLEGSRFTALAKRGVMPLLRAARLAG
jgi:hypothetical protein